MSNVNRQQGLSLIELMVAVSIGIMLLTGVIQMFVSSKQSYRTAESLSRMQENSRYAVSTLTKDLRSAGFQPCKKTGKVANVLNSTPAGLNFFGAPLVGYDGTSSTFDSDFPAVGTTAGARVAGADAVRIIRGGGTGFSVEAHNPTSAQFKLVGGAHEFVDGDIVLVCDSENSSIMQITNANQENVTIVHNTGTGTPGNCTKGLGSPVVCTSNGTPKTYGKGSQIVSIESFIYYLGISASGEGNSLYRKRLINNTGAAALGSAEELVEGIESMQIIYGVGPDTLSPAQRYVTANQLTGATPADTEANWQKVVSVRIGLLMVTPDNISSQADTTNYNVVGTSVAHDNTGTAPAYTSDRRQRYTFTSTIKLRNRGTL